MPTTPSGRQRSRAVGTSSKRCQPGPSRSSARALPPCRTVQRMASSVATTSPQRLARRLADLVADRVGPGVGVAGESRAASGRATADRSRQDVSDQTAWAARARATRPATSSGGGRRRRGRSARRSRDCGRSGRRASTLGYGHHESPAFETGSTTARHRRPGRRPSPAR